MVTWQQLGFHAKPVGVLNIDGFYDTLLQFFDRCVSDVRPCPPNMLPRAAATLSQQSLNVLEGRNSLKPRLLGVHGRLLTCGGCQTFGDTAPS